jgi:hypothetical protein
LVPFVAREGGEMPYKSDDGLKAAREFFDQLLKEPGNLTAAHSDLVRLAKDRGFECTAEDLTKALQEIWASRSDFW